MEFKIVELENISWEEATKAWGKLLESLLVEGEINFSCLTDGENPLEIVLKKSEQLTLKKGEEYWIAKGQGNRYPKLVNEIERITKSTFVWNQEYEVSAVLKIPRQAWENTGVGIKDSGKKINLSHEIIKRAEYFSCNMDFVHGTETVVRDCFTNAALAKYVALELLQLA